MLYLIWQQVWKTQQWPQDWKRSIFIPVLKRGNAKECSNCYTIALISHVSDVMLKLLEARFKSIGAENFQMYKLDLGKAEAQEIKSPTSVGSSIKQKSSRKTSSSAPLTMPKPFTMWITRNCEKFFKRLEYHNTLPTSWDICMPAKKQQLGVDME